MVEQRARQRWMGLLATAPAARLAALWAAAGIAAEAAWLRAPESGAVMAQGRAGGDGAAFNLGEVTVTRCALRLPCGAVGHACVQGRDARKAEIAALCDALMQTDAAPAVRRAILDPLEAERAERRAAEARKAAATQVEFFTVARGED
jgi:alpha-D-ribose 1-methylphosphonate 5-triphosphate synthase subunit PhnG